MELEINLKDLVIFQGKKRFVKGIADDGIMTCVLLHWDKSWECADFYDFKPKVFVLNSLHLENYIQQGFKLDLEHVKTGREYCWVSIKYINRCGSLEFMINEINLELDK